MINPKISVNIENLKKGEINMPKKIELIAELKNSIDREMIHNKFLVTIYDGSETSEINDKLNKLYNQQKTRAENALMAKNYNRYLIFHTRPYRLHALLEIFDIVKNDKTKAELLTHYWQDTVEPYINLKYWIELFKYFDGKEELLMSEEENQYFNNLPEEITIYRGADRSGGISWTLDKETAKWYANRFNFNNKGKVFEKIVKKSDCLCYLLNEQEIIIIN